MSPFFTGEDHALLLLPPTFCSRLELAVRSIVAEWPRSWSAIGVGLLVLAARPPLRVRSGLVVARNGESGR